MPCFGEDLAAQWTMTYKVVQVLTILGRTR